MLNVAILGAGAISRVHIDAFLLFSNECTITAICNHNIAKAEDLINSKGLENARAYASLEDAAANGHIDIVSICLPPNLHCESAVKALDLGMHVLVEKPMANSLEECDKMIEAAKRSSKKLGIVFQLRFNSASKRIHDLINSGFAGKLVYGNIDSMWWRGSHYHDLSWRGSWEKEGGGVLTSQSIHHLDLTRYILGDPVSVTASMDNVGHDNTQCEDVLTAILHYPGAFVQFTSSLCSHGQKQELTFQCEDASLTIPWYPTAYSQQSNGYPSPNNEKLEKLCRAYEEMPELEYENHEGQIKDFLWAVINDTTPLVDGYEGRKTLELTTAIYQAAWSGEKVTLPLTKDSPLYTVKGKAENLPHFHEKYRTNDKLSCGPITLAK